MLCVPASGPACPAGYRLSCDTASECSVGDAGPLRACVVPTDCAVVAESCCGTCGLATPDDMIGILGDRSSTYHADVCAGMTCTACRRQRDSALVATCDAGTCQAVDLHTSTITACTSDADCDSAPPTAAPATPRSSRSPSPTTATTSPSRATPRTHALFHLSHAAARDHRRLRSRPSLRGRHRHHGRLPTAASALDGLGRRGGSAAPAATREHGSWPLARRRATLSMWTPRSSRRTNGAGSNRTSGGGGSRIALPNVTPSSTSPISTTPSSTSSAPRRSGCVEGFGVDTLGLTDTAAALPRGARPPRRLLSRGRDERSAPAGRAWRDRGHQSLVCPARQSRHRRSGPRGGRVLAVRQLRHASAGARGAGARTASTS